MKTLLASIALGLLAAPSHAEVLILQRRDPHQRRHQLSVSARRQHFRNRGRQKQPRRLDPFVHCSTARNGRLFPTPSEFRFGQAPLKGGKTTSFISVVLEQRRGQRFLRAGRHFHARDSTPR
jgi:hypothetical protein